MSSWSSKRKHQNHMRRQIFQWHRFPVTLGLIHCFQKHRKRQAKKTLQSQKEDRQRMEGLERILKGPVKFLLIKQFWGLIPSLPAWLWRLKCLTRMLSDSYVFWPRWNQQLTRPCEVTSGAFLVFKVIHRSSIWNDINIFFLKWVSGHGPRKIRNGKSSKWQRRR